MQDLLLAITILSNYPAISVNLMNRSIQDTSTHRSQHYSYNEGIGNFLSARWLVPPKVPTHEAGLELTM